MLALPKEHPIIGENIYPENIVDTGVNEIIKMDEIIRVLHKAKDVMDMTIYQWRC